MIGNLKVTFSGKTSQEGNFLPTRVEKIGTGEWFKITPVQPPYNRENMQWWKC